LQGEVFNIISYSSPTFEEITLASKIAGFKGTVTPNYIGVLEELGTRNFLGGS